MSHTMLHRHQSQGESFNKDEKQYEPPMSHTMQQMEEPIEERFSRDEHRDDDPTLRPQTRSTSSERTVSAGLDEQVDRPSSQERHDADAKPETNHETDSNNDPEASRPTPVGFWDHSLAHVRIHIFKHWIITTLILMTFIITALSIYWGVLFNLDRHLSRLPVAIVSFDNVDNTYPSVSTPLIGDAVTRAASAQAQQTSGVVGYRVEDASKYNNDPMRVRQAVYDEHVWAAIIVNTNATYLLQEAVSQGNASYDPLGAMQLIYIQARDQETYASYIIPQLTAFLTNVQAGFGQQWIANVLSDSSYSSNTYQNVPQALNPAIGTSMFNLRPFGPPTATPAVSIGLIYLIIVSFFTFPFYLPIHQQFLVPKGHPPLHFYQLILWRLCATITAYFFLSLAYSLVSLAFQIPFSYTGPRPELEVVAHADSFGKGTFVVYWMLNFIGMIALGLASENVSMIIGTPWTALWLIFWVITNVATSFYEIELAPSTFFRWGYAWPLHNVVQASRTILFDTYSRLGLNFGILAAWCVLNVALFVPCAIFMRWKSSKEQMHKCCGHDTRQEIRYLVDG